MERKQVLPNITLTETHSLASLTSRNLIMSQKLKPDGSNWQILTKRRRQAYFSTTTYLDQLVGSLLEVLDDTGLANNTIVTLVSDHGVKMEDLGAWGNCFV